ncbi:hypothetical protein FisN_14Lh252 [Fistulifera solaris]|uniref:Uncharacterized protein n=1 Tax=Fistulifera solaris TaxID=1519565 RepID=A0A1Z5JA12_FISSO|nr:hypothetical protein FisN_14Lh252 [Fistulifera solaris]|eukprot:GAX10732.1 hypothetical protein FisN_14Lh252 [Fistulifera solaris]
MLRKFSLLTCWTASVSLFERSNAEPCVNTAYEDIYTCTDPEVMLADPTIQCDPATCLWNLNAFNPGQPPEPCAAILLLEQQVADLPDLLEPCLWWEMLYGDLGYLLPEPAVVVPSPNPSPLGDLSVAPTLVESDTPSVDYTVGPSYSSLETSPPPSSTTADKDVTPSPSRVGKLSIPLQSMLLTFVFERYRGFRLRRLNEIGLLATDESRDALMKVTREHLIANIPQVVDADLTMSRVDQGETPNEKMETLLLMGTLYFAAEAAAENSLPDLSPTSVRRQVEDVFDDNDSVLRFIHALRETDQAAFQDIVLVYPGIVSPDSDLQRTSNDEEESFWDSFFFNWQNPVWIVVAAGVSAALLGLCAVLGVTCYVRAERRKELAHHQLATRKSDDTSKTAGERNLYNVEESVHEDDISMNGQSEIGYQESEVTSVYSYLDNNNTMLDDQSFSVAPSYTFPGPEYDDNRSVMWSVIHDAKKNDILDDLDSIAGVSLATRQTTAENRSVVRERQLSEDSDDDVFSLLSQNGGPSPPSETKRKSSASTPTPQDNPASLEKVAGDGAASKASPESISGASQASRESLSKFSKMVTGFRAKNSSVKVSPKNYQQLDDSDGSHHSWDKELGIQPSPDDLDEDSVFMDDSEEDETVASHLAPLSSIQRISSGGENVDSDASSNENADVPNDDNNSVDSRDSHGKKVEPAQFVVRTSDTIDTGYLATYSEDTAHSDGKDSTSSEKENISIETALDGDLKNDENTADEIQTGSDGDNTEQEPFDDLIAPPLTEKIECSDNIQTSESETGNLNTELAEKEKIDLDQLPKKHSPEEEAPVDLNDNKPSNLVVEDEVPAIYTLASF